MDLVVDALFDLARGAYFSGSFVRPCIANCTRHELIKFEEVESFEIEFGDFPDELH